jgi:sensor histidine kinase YesM
MTSKRAVRTGAESSLWRVMLHAGRNAPRWGQIAILGLVALVVAVTAISTAGLMNTRGPGVRQQFLSVIMAHSGMVLLGTAIFLHHLTQRPQTWRALLGKPLNVRSVRLHSLLLALPLTAFTAGCLLAVSTALLIPTMVEPSGRPFILIGLLYAGVVILAGNTVRETTRFLYRHAKDQAQAAAAAQGEAAQARLAALQAQMNPHFLFNALNTVASLTASDPGRAERTVEHLSHMLRRTLDRSRETTSTLADEIDYVRAYLSIERERFGERLQVEWAVDPDTTGVHIPPLTLQPLVENAIKYAIGARMGGGTITISTASRNGSVHLTVRDDGPGFPAGYRPGLGLSNLRTRLETMFGEDGRLTVDSRPGHTVVDVTVPGPGPGPAPVPT